MTKNIENLSYQINPSQSIIWWKFEYRPNFIFCLVRLIYDWTILFIYNFSNWKKEERTERDAQIKPTINKIH